jgi:hypothetical protein
MMSDAELEELGKDIQANGLQSPLVVWNDLLLDGRNRLEAMERAEIEVLPGLWAELSLCNDPVAFVISANIHRRHLTKAQQADLIVAAIKAGEKLAQVEPVSDEVGQPTPFPADVAQRQSQKGGRGKTNKVKAKAVAAGKKLGLSESTMKRSLRKAAEGKAPKYTARPLPKPRSGKPVLGLEASRRHYLDSCATDPNVNLDVELEIIVEALKELAGKRTMARQTEVTP